MQWRLHSASRGLVLGHPDAGYLALRWRTKIRLLAAHHGLVHRLPRDAEHGRGHALVQSISSTRNLRLRESSDDHDAWASAPGGCVRD